METAEEWVTAVSTLVTSNDDLVGSSEGLECLLLQSFYQSNAGHLRKSWLSTRRAASLGQLMGIDRSNAPIRSCDPRSDQSKRPAPSLIWFKTVFCDRYLSLILGLPVVSLDNSFATEEATRNDSPVEKLEKAYTVISGRIVERNRSKASEAYGMTQSIDCEIGAASKIMASAWWNQPELDPHGTPLQIITRMRQLLLQLHYHGLLIFLHLPYMLRDATESRYDYSKATCLRSSREVLVRFISFRSVNLTAYSCRHVDYASLIAAMTLLLGYLGQSGTGVDDLVIEQRKEDRRLICETRQKMVDISVANHDKLSAESADIIKQLLPIIDKADSPDMLQRSDSQGLLQLVIPYLGRINIKPGASQAPTSERLESHPSILCCSGSINGLLSIDSSLQQMPPDADFFAPIDGGESVPGMMLEGDGDDLFSFPGLTAAADDWAFQGIDTAYWSLVSSGLNDGSGTDAVM